MESLADSVIAYVRETRALEALPTSTETSFYPDLKNLLAAVLKHERLPFDVITGTSEGGTRRRDMPDFVLGDSSLFVGVYGEVKRTDTTLVELAVSTEQSDQIGRYLSQTGVVLLCNVRGIGLLTCDPAFKRETGKAVPPTKRILERSVDLWSAVSGSGPKAKADLSAVEELASMVTRAVTDLARIASPADLAKILARQARDAKAAMPEDLRPVKPLL